MADSFQRYKAILDPADTLFAANYLLGYFGSVDNAPELMRRQKVEDLKRKNLWEEKDYFASAFKASEVIDPYGKAIIDQFSAEKITWTEKLFNSPVSGLRKIFGMQNSK